MPKPFLKGHVTDCVVVFVREKLEGDKFGQ